MLEANGSKCFCCGRAITLETCQRGHIGKRNPDGSNDGPENIGPICQPCNSHHVKDQITPYDHLAPDYFGRLRILILAQIPGPISCKLMAPSRKLILTTQVDENTHFIDLEHSEFDPRTEVYTTSRKLSPDEAKGIVENFVTETRRNDNTVPAADDVQQRLMISKVMDNGAKAFLRVGNRVVLLRRWQDSNGRIDLYFWKREIVDSFYHHESEARREEKECAEAEKKAAANREIARVDQLAGAAAHREYVDKRKRLVSHLDLLDEMIAETEELRTSGYSTAFLREGLLAAAGNMQGLRELHKGIQELYDILRQLCGPETGDFLLSYSEDSQLALEKNEPQPEKHNV
jgi:hypothetical protein